MTTKTQESPETIIKRYKKANSKYKQTLLKRYGVSNIERVREIFNTSSTEKKLTKTELASFLLDNKGVTLEVSFQKKMDKKEALKELITINTYVSKEEAKSRFKDFLEEIIEGTERYVKGHHSGKTTKFGQLFMVDENIPLDKSKNYDNRMVLCNLSTLNWIKLNGIKYIKK